MKEIPLDDYYHFKSCVSCTFYPGVDSSLLYLYDLLGVKYANPDDQSSCTGFCYYNGSIPWKTNLTLNARNLALVEETGKSCVCVCPTSYGNLRECSEYLVQNPEALSNVNSILNKIKKKYNGTARIYHASEIIYAHRDRLAKHAKYNLDGLKVATHHGCHYTRIFYDDTIDGKCESPTLLDEIAKTFNAKIVEYSEKSLCCGMGFYHTLENKEYTEAISLRKLRSIRDSKPDLILTQCPGCLFTLDYFQAFLENAIGEKFSIPVLNYAELAALLTGADPAKLIGIDTHRIPLESLIHKIGIKTK